MLFKMFGMLSVESEIPSRSCGNMRKEVTAKKVHLRGVGGRGISCVGKWAGERMWHCRIFFTLLTFQDEMVRWGSGGAG